MMYFFIHLYYIYAFTFFDTFIYFIYGSQPYKGFGRPFRLLAMFRLHRTPGVHFILCCCLLILGRKPSHRGFFFPLAELDDKAFV